MEDKKDLFIELYDVYVHGTESRRAFLRKLVRTAGGAAAAAAVLPWLEGTGAEAAMVPADDSRLDIKVVHFPGGAGEMAAYVARPKGAGKLPTVVVIHENRGLTDHIRDVARRVALAGYNAVAPDMLAPLGGTPKDRDKARDMLYGRSKKDLAANLKATVEFAGGLSEGTGKVGVVGFCWGGGQALNAAVAVPSLDAAVSYYGNAPKSGLENIHAALLLNYAEKDPKRTKGIKPFVASLKKMGRSPELHFYPGTKHAFNNDTRPARYNKAAATLAWERTIAHFKKHFR